VCKQIKFLTENDPYNCSDDNDYTSLGEIWGYEKNEVKMRKKRKCPVCPNLVDSRSKWFPYCGSKCSRDNQRETRFSNVDTIHAEQCIALGDGNFHYKKMI